MKILRHGMIVGMFALCAANYGIAMEKPVVKDMAVEEQVNGGWFSWLNPKSWTSLFGALSAVEEQKNPEESDVCVSSVFRPDAQEFVVQRESVDYTLCVKKTVKPYSAILELASGVVIELKKNYITRIFVALYFGNLTSKNRKGVDIAVWNNIHKQLSKDGVAIHVIEDKNKQQEGEVITVQGGKYTRNEVRLLDILVDGKSLNSILVEAGYASFNEKNEEAE